MGSKSSKWLAASLSATALAVVPSAAGAKLDYSKNSVSGQYIPSPSSAELDYSKNSVSGQYIPSPTTPAHQVVRGAQPDSGFAWGDAIAGGGAVLLLAFAGGTIVVRRRHPSPLAS